MPKLRFANDLATRIFHLLRDRKANVAVIFALVMVPTIYLLGMTLDYSQVIRKRAQLNAAADAAVIAAVTPSMLSQSSTLATAAATNVFNATANGLPGLASTPSLNVNVTNSGLVRTATVSYTAASTNNFPILLGTAAWPFNGSSSASASGAPNINFYLLLDDSPSMAIAGTPAGITTMVNNTSAQGGCAFACHETNPAGENPALGNPHGEDNYALARNLGVTLRIDLMAQAAANLMSTAQTTEAANNNTYKVAIYTFDTGLNTIYAPSGLPSTNLSSAATAAANIAMLEVYDNNWLTSSNNNSDTDTNFSSALQSLNTTMPNPGGGTSNAGDTPQEVVFIVTDGVEDKAVSSTSACSQPTVSIGSGQYRCQQPFDTTWCTTVKNRGIRIAVLYTEYLQLPTNSWYNSYIAPFDNPTPSTSLVATNLQSCASSGLFYDVQSGGDITAALNALFQLVVASAAHLTQ
jgi:Flp pilus assembly protein TadG